jgi:hypothetical protein
MALRDADGTTGKNARQAAVEDVYLKRGDVKIYGPAGRPAFIKSDENIPRAANAREANCLAWI